MTDSSGCLLASVTDGDVRRALLSGSLLDSPAQAAFQTNVTCLTDGADSAARTSEGAVRRIVDYPVVDSSGKLLCVETERSKSSRPDRNNTVVIMAGGEGLRLRPLTENTPKPLLFVGGKPILQHIIENLRDEGFSDIVIAVNYLAAQIQEFFADGSDFGVRIRYVKEEVPLGTAGALSLLEEPTVTPLVVMNGDLISTASVGKMVEFHVHENADITVGAKVIETTTPFGVLLTDGPVVKAIEEKPTRSDLVNAGVYVLSGKVIAKLSRTAPTDMPELIEQNLAGQRVLAFPLHEDWLDLGRQADLDKARVQAEGA